MTSAIDSIKNYGWYAACLVSLVFACGEAAADEHAKSKKLTARPGLFQPLNVPACNYCSTQHRKGFIENDDRVIAWLRGRHNGGAIPLRHFLSVPRVINDTYGLFFYDPDGGFVAAYGPDSGYTFHGWRGGVMVVKGSDGTLWSALSGRAFEGPQKGKQLRRIPSMVTNWQHWLMLHPESVAFQMYDGKRYPLAPLPKEMSKDAKLSMGDVDGRLKPLANVVGVTHGKSSKAYPLEAAGQRAVFTDSLDGRKIAVFWYGPTQSAVAFSSELDGQQLTFYADKSSPETAPFKDRETGTRWTLAGRAVDGKLRGKELKWVDSIQCRWYAWSSEYPETELYDFSK